MHEFVGALAKLGSLIDVRTVIDAGAHYGSLSLHFVQLYPAARVHCFEPDPANFSRLKETMADSPGAVLVNAALASADGPMTFHRNAFDATSSLYPRSSTGKRYWRADYVMTEAFEVPARSIDSYCAEHDITQIDMIKLDTQGGEFEIFRGAERMLNAQAISIIGTEFFIVPHYEGAPTLDQMWPLLKSHGYSLFDLFINQRANDGQARDGDAIFISDRFRSEVIDRLPAEP